MTFVYKLFLTANFLVFTFYFTTAQWYDPQKVNRKANSIYTEEINNALTEKYSVAIDQINEALKIDPKLVDAYLSLGGINANLKNYNESVINFEKAFSLDSVYSKYYYLPYSISLAGAGKFDKALEAVNIFLTSEKLNERSLKAANFRKKCYEFAIDYDKKHPTKNYLFNPINLGENINTANLEYFPSLTIDGKKNDLYRTH
jgi:tetratricopeptide (TPR) repeat protein